jgi:hypothetical protein
LEARLTSRKPINLKALFTGGNRFDEADAVMRNGAEVDPDGVSFQFTIALLRGGH